MTRFETLEGIRAAVTAGQTPAVEIHGLDPVLYVLYRSEGTTTDAATDAARGQGTAADGAGSAPLPVCDRKGKMLRYPSRYAAQRALADCGLTRATFIHRSAYGEMVGLDDAGANNELRETLILSSD